MSINSPPIEAQRFRRSQTPESPRPVHIPEPSTIPVLLNQMDPVFNDTTTYNIPTDQTFSPYGDSLDHGEFQNSAADHDAVQSFLREAENQANIEPIVSHVQNDSPSLAKSVDQFPSVAAHSQVTSVEIEGSGLASAGDKQLEDIDAPHSGTQVEEAQGEPTQEQGSGDTLSSQQRDTESDTSPATSWQNGTENTYISPGNASGGVDYQSLLDNILQSNHTALPTEGTTMPTTASTSETPDPNASSLPLFPGLPPKPPPQESNVPLSNYANVPDQPFQSTLSISTAIEPGNPPLQTLQNDTSLNANQTSPLPTVPPFNGQTTPFAHLNHDASMQAQPGYQSQQPSGATTPPRSMDPADRPWSPKTQSVYDQFLEDERRYVTEGIWDKFPFGSRLFVGNLPSEKVTKRDLFHPFHQHGRLAQISIKQAYGFVQYLDASSCLAAMNAEQGIEIRGRKVHLEVSKPQKNTRSAGHGQTKTQGRRRSRSPEQSHRRVDDHRDDGGRRRDSYRNRRSPSPRHNRSRDDFRASRDGRRSPPRNNNYNNPQPPTYDDEANLPIPRREPQNVPDVQLIIMDSQVQQNFINWVEDGIRRKGLQVMTVWLNQRLPLAGVIKRQIIEGVQAIVKLDGSAQSRGKIPLQVFDRSAGHSNVNFNEYVNLDLSVAGDIVLQARQKEHSARTHYQPQSYGPPNQYSVPPRPPMMGFPPVPPPIPFSHPPHHQHPHQHYPYPPQPQGGYPTSSSIPPTPSSQPANLQELLANLKGGNNPPTPQSATSATNPRADLAGLLSNVNRQQGQPGSHGYGQTLSPYSPYSATPSGQFPFHGGQMPPQQGGSSQPNMQNIMDQLARYHR